MVESILFISQYLEVNDGVSKAFKDGNKSFVSVRHQLGLRGEIGLHIIYVSCVYSFSI